MELEVSRSRSIKDPDVAAIGQAVDHLIAGEVDSVDLALDEARFMQVVRDSDHGGWAIVAMPAADRGPWVARGQELDREELCAMLGDFAEGGERWHGAAQWITERQYLNTRAWHYLLVSVVLLFVIGVLVVILLRP